jgi:hypothetical protein
MDKFFTGLQTIMKRKQSNELIYCKITSAAAGMRPEVSLKSAWLNPVISLVAGN